MVTSAQRHRQASHSVDQPDLTLIELWEEGSTQIERTVMNTEAVTHQGNEYLPAGFQIKLPNSDDRSQDISATIPNASRLAGQVVLNARKRIQCRMIHIDGTDHDVALWDTKNMFVVYDAVVDTLVVSGNLGNKADPQMPYPFAYTGKKEFPGLWLK